tara:strand:- start:619 stop:750 length:132 start_codon:yes stop_codon:yes gene_type:complete
MSSKFFGNRLDNKTKGKNNIKQNFNNKNNKAKSSGIRKVGRGS